MATKIIGSITTYTGDEIPGLKGRRVRVFGVMRGALRPDVNVDAEDYLVADDDVLVRIGGVTQLDRIDVAQVKGGGRVSFVHCDAKATDLECFARALSGP